MFGGGGGGSVCVCMYVCGWVGRWVAVCVRGKKWPSNERSGPVCVCISKSQLV